MGYWQTRGLRGSTFEDMVNMTNELYRQKGLALVQKIPTSITPTRLDPKTSTITQAYFEKKSTVDYMGVVQGVPICFDAKETTRKSFPLRNIHDHQIAFMADFEKQGGLAFLLVHFTLYSQVFCLPYFLLKSHWDEAKQGGRQSIPYDSFDKALLVESKEGCLLHYLEGLNVMLRMISHENQEMKG